MDSEAHLIVAAIDCGTTYSGYAISTFEQYKKNPTECLIGVWSAESCALQSMKTSSCILFDKYENFDSFGFEAETKYADFALENKHHDWLFFERFKMNLYQQHVRISLIRRFFKENNSENKNKQTNATLDYSILKLFRSFFL